MPLRLRGSVKSPCAWPLGSGSSLGCSTRHPSKWTTGRQGSGHYVPRAAAKGAPEFAPQAQDWVTHRKPAPDHGRRHDAPMPTDPAYGDNLDIPSIQIGHADGIEGNDFGHDRTCSARRPKQNKPAPVPAREIHRKPLELVPAARPRQPNPVLAQPRKTIVARG